MAEPRPPDAPSLDQLETPSAPIALGSLGKSRLPIIKKAVAGVVLAAVGTRAGIGFAKDFGLVGGNNDPINKPQATPLATPENKPQTIPKVSLITDEKTLSDPNSIERLKIQKEIEQKYGIELLSQLQLTELLGQQINSINGAQVGEVLPMRWTLEELENIDQALSELPKSLLASIDEKNVKITIGEFGTNCHCAGVSFWDTGIIGIGRKEVDAGDRQSISSITAHELTHRLIALDPTLHPRIADIIGHDPDGEQIARISQLYMNGHEQFMEYIRYEMGSSSNDESPTIDPNTAQAIYEFYRDNVFGGEEYSDDKIKAYTKLRETASKHGMTVNDKFSNGITLTEVTVLEKALTIFPNNFYFTNLPGRTQWTLQLLQNPSGGVDSSPIVHIIALPRDYFTMKDLVPGEVQISNVVAELANLLTQSELMRPGNNWYERSMQVLGIASEEEDPTLEITLNNLQKLYPDLNNLKDSNPDLYSIFIQTDDDGNPFFERFLTFSKMSQLYLGGWKGFTFLAEATDPGISKDVLMDEDPRTSNTKVAQLYRIFEDLYGLQFDSTTDTDGVPNILSV